MYAGHLVFNERIVKYDAHKAIVNLDNWQFAFDHLSDVDFDGNPIEREARSVRYIQKTSVDSGALLAGTRDNGKLVIDGTNGAHVYYNKAKDAYLLLRYGVPISVWLRNKHCCKRARRDTYRQMTSFCLNQRSCSQNIHLSRL